MGPTTTIRVTTNLDEQPRLVASLEERTHLILRNHGLLVAAPYLPTAFNCDIQLASDAANGPDRAMSEQLLEKIPQTRASGRSE